jgi:ComF family protein
VASEYYQPLAGAIKSYKFKRNRALARPLACLLAEQLPYFKFPPVIVPIPTATTRIRRRGYDHAKMLAEALAKQTSWACVALLRRVGQTRQVGAKRISRIEQLKGAFRPVRRDMILGSNILLVDDVITTGATVSEAARVLKLAGAKSVSAVALAQKS